MSKTVEYAEGPKATKNFEEGMRALSQRLHVGANDIADPAAFGVAVDFVDASFLLAKAILQCLNCNIESELKKDDKRKQDEMKGN